MKTIITIGRQFGSGGKEIGIRVSKELGIPFYDKELLQEAAKKSGLCHTPDRGGGALRHHWPVRRLCAGREPQSAEPVYQRAHGEPYRPGSEAAEGNAGGGQNADSKDG